MAKVTNREVSENILVDYKINTENSYKETIDKQMTKLFRKKTTIALFVIGTPLLILVWPIICAVVYANAKIKVDRALAYQKISLINRLSNELENAENKTPEEVFEDLLL